MPLYRVQAIFEHDNGLPRDAATCTFHFNDNDDNADLDAVATDVVEFFADATATGQAISWNMATTHDSVYAKVYEVNDSIVDDRLVSNSGPPLTTTLVRSIATDHLSLQNLPSEVACVMSIRDTTLVGTPRARRTGRIYIGPLNQDAADHPSGGISRPTATFRTTINQAAARLKTDAAGHGATWVIYSRPFPGRDAIIRPGRTTLPALPARPVGSVASVDQVWVDDAFDTQRRRGVRSTGKTSATI